MSARSASFVAAVVAALALATSAFAQLPGTPVPAKPAASSAKDDDKPVQPTRGEDRDVIAASQKWLKLIDAGHYGDAWDGGAAPLKKMVTRKDFVDGIAQARKPLGKVASRSTADFARAHELPGGPEGDYALVLFNTRFANGKTAQEQVIWLLESGQDWRVSGYYIR
jgi:hypothetical protein